MPTHAGPTAAVGILETTGWTPAMVALDAMEKSAAIEVWQVELNDFLGTCVKIVGAVDAVNTALKVGHEIAGRLHGEPYTKVLTHPTQEALVGIASEVQFNPLIQQNVVKEIDPSRAQAKEEGPTMSEVKALGFIETQGFTAVFAAIDTACKAAQVDVVAKEKLGGGYVTIVIRGDVAAVRAAIDAATPSVEGLGKLIAAHVIARPSESVLALLP